MVGARSAPPLLALLLALACASSVAAQTRQHEIECSSLLFSGCRDYEIDVFRVEPGGHETQAENADTYKAADPDTLDPGDFLVVKMYEGDALKGRRSVIWVERSSGAVGGDWPANLSNDAVRSVELRGMPGDAVELWDDIGRVAARGLTRMVVFARSSSCRTKVSLDVNVGGCAVMEGQTVAGKVSRIAIRYRAPREGGAAAEPDSLLPSDSSAAPTPAPQP